MQITLWNDGIFAADFVAIQSVRITFSVLFNEFDYIFVKAVSIQTTSKHQIKFLLLLFCVFFFLVLYNCASALSRSVTVAMDDVPECLTRSAGILRIDKLPILDKVINDTIV